ncbi:MAG: flagella basal body P-ring formation protein FlgA [Novosphingobium sp.]
MAGFASLIVATSLIFAADAEIRGDIVRLGDVADVTVLPLELRLKAADLPLAVLDKAATRASVSTGFLAAQARARMPLLGRWLARSDREFVTLTRPAAAGLPIVRAAGTQGVTKGEAVTVRVAIGPFRVEREGVALGTAHPDERVFVRTADGQVISAVCREGER